MSQEIESVRESNKREFDEYKFATSLPEILLVYTQSPIPYGAQGPGADIRAVDIDMHRWVMERVWFTTPIRIHGLLHMQTSTQLFFMGYKCGKCDRIFLVPDVRDYNEVVEQMRHECHV